MNAIKGRRSFLATCGLAAAATARPLAAFGQAVDNAKQASSPSALRITDLKCGYVRGSLFVKVHTNQGIWGCGEGVDAIGGTYNLVQSIGQRIRDQNPLNVHRIFEQVRKGGVFGGAQAGVFVAVLTAVETALWDLAGKALNVPVYQLLGGKFRDKIRVYCDTALYQARLPTPDVFAAAASKAVKDGYTAMKFDLDQAADPNKYDQFNWTASPAEVQRMVDQLTAARQAVGPNVDICADMHARYDYPTALQVARRLEPLNLMWLEEPVPAENIDAYKLIADSTSTPICAGENVYLAHGFRRMLETGRTRHHHARPAENRRPGRRAADRQPGESLLRAVRAAHGGVVPRRDGVVPCLRVGAELPDSRVADVLRHQPHVQGDGDLRRTAGGKRLHHRFGEARHRRRDQRGRYAPLRHAGCAVLRVGPCCPVKFCRQGRSSGAVR